MLSLGTKVRIKDTTLEGQTCGNAFSYLENKSQVYELVELKPGYWDESKFIFTRLVVVHRDNLEVLEAE